MLLKNLTLQNRHVLILGHGISGRAMARWCARLGANVTVADTRAASSQAEQALLEELTSLSVAPDQQHQHIQVPFDGNLVHRQSWALIGKSPGLSPQQLATLTQAAQTEQILVLGELALFADALHKVYGNAGFMPKIVAITGTNGKTTTTSLTGQLLNRAGWRVAVAGNIGPAMLDVLTATSTDHLPEVWVLELSSFQLDGVPIGAAGFEPSAATVLNITQDHLDWHGSMANYAQAKFRVFGETGIRVLNREDPLVMEATNLNTKGRAEGQIITFGTDMPQQIGDWGLETVNGMTWLVQRIAQDASPLQQGKKTTTAISLPLSQPSELLRLMPADALRIRGRHNASNALAALALASAIDAPLAPMLHGLRDYRGEPHRVESVAIINGIEFFDDSKGTNVGATLAAINGLGIDRKLVVILGGDGKGQDFSPLIPAIQAHVKAAVLIGRDAPILRQTLAATSVLLIDAIDMPSAVVLAAQHAESGDAVLLSPACASLDMFTNYAHRAEVFCQAVKHWGVEHGLVGEIG